MKTYRADLHVHSSHSNKPTYWAMRKFNCPESYTSPLHLYQTARERGMDYVTITDHNAISGALEIIGDGPYRSEMESALKGYPALFTGYLSGEELQAGYASADLFVFPSATDTFGNVVLEAQASGLGVIVSDQGGPQELMVDGETGLVFPAGSEEALITGIRRLINDRLRLVEMGRSARRFTLSNGPDSASTFATILQSAGPSFGYEEKKLAA